MTQVTTTPTLHPDAEAALDRLAADSARIRELQAALDDAYRARRAAFLDASRRWPGVTYGLIAERCGVSKGLVHKEVPRAIAEAEAAALPG